MANSTHLDLPLLDAAQAQKHVTVNDSLTRLDALAQISVISRSVGTPPPASEGDCYLVPAGATGDWAGLDGSLVLYSNGGWIGIVPKEGWVLHVQSEEKMLAYTGTSWGALAHQTVSPLGAETQDIIIEVTHDITGGAANTTAAAIPANSVVTGVSARVSTAIAVTAGSSWQLGVSGATNRYGSGLGLALNSYALGVSGSPLAYYADTDVVLTCEGGDFISGQIVIAIHCKVIAPPAAF